MKVFILTLNQGIVGAFSSKERVKNWLEVVGEVSNLKFERQKELSLDEGIEYLLKNDTVWCFTEGLIEMGDDYCEMLLEEVEVQ
jgi:hypothetical protein